MSKPLHTLRQWISKVTPDGISQIDESTPGQLQFQGQTLDLNQETEYLSQKGIGSPYTLHQVWYFYKNRNMKFPEYIKMAKEAKIPIILFQDKTEMVEWLEGKKRSITAISENEEEDKKEETTEKSQEESQANNEKADEKIQKDETEKEEKTKQEENKTKFDVNIEDEVESQEKVPVVEFERLRPIDSCLLCMYDFSVMINQTKKFESEDKNKSAQELSSKMGVEDDTWKAHQKEGKFKNYIILVPRSIKPSIVNNTNVFKFLNENVQEQPYEDANLKYKSIVHTHSVNARTCVYDIVADESLLRDDDWNKVVAVFLLDKKWQIKNFNQNDQRDLFKNILGVYVGFDDAPVPEEIQGWRIKKYQLNKERRSDDSRVVQNIWHDIEESTDALRKRRKEK